MKDGQQDNTWFKCKYQINLLLSMSKEDGSLMQAVADTDELEIFETEAIIMLINFNWTQYAGKIHSTAALSHCCYLFFQLGNIFTTFLESPILDS
jgi:hypothetical protein